MKDNINYKNRVYGCLFYGLIAIAVFFIVGIVYFSCNGLGSKI